MDQQELIRKFNDENRSSFNEKLFERSDDECGNGRSF